jgi:hypothetical protein
VSNQHHLECLPLVFNSAVDRFGHHWFHLWEPGKLLWLCPGIVLAVLTAFVRNHRWAVRCSLLVFALSLPPALWIFTFIAARAAGRFSYVGFDFRLVEIASLYFAILGGWLVLLVAGLIQLRRHSLWLLEHPLALTGGFEVMLVESRQPNLVAWLVAIIVIANPMHPVQAQQSMPSTKPASARNWTLPPTAPLSPEDEIKTFRIMPGYRVELIAAEPLVHDPIAMSIDPHGRLWVCEMRGFMRDVKRTGEMDPSGTISVLDGQDSQGAFHKSPIFVDGLVLPRAVCWTSDGILVAENGHIWLCRDSHGGLHCDQKTLVCQYNVGNLEHALNGLVPMLDNWLYAAREGIRLRRIDGKWVRDVIASRGQWGITQDDHGYLVYNFNAQLIRGDLVPCYSPSGVVPNPLVNVAFFKEQQVWPIRPNPGINRGYIDSWLRPDGSMIEANADCGPVVYVCDNLPAELRGNVFIP